MTSSKKLLDTEDIKLKFINSNFNQKLLIFTFYAFPKYGETVIQYVLIIVILTFHIITNE